MDKYISISKGVTAKTFANIGFLTGLSSAILSTVYSLILYRVFKSDVLVGVYSSFFAAVGLIFTLFSAELFRLFNKTQLTLFGFITIILATFGMSFPITVGSFISLDIARELSIIIMGMSLSLFMVEFSTRESLARVTGRYNFLANLGAILGPLIGAYFAEKFDDLFPLKVVSFFYLLAVFYFISKHLKAEEKDARPRKIVSIGIKILKNIKRFIKRPDLRSMYMIAFGYYGSQSLRSLYVPLAIVNAGYSKDVIGLILSLGIIPFIVFSPIISNLSIKYGVKKFFLLGYISFAICALFASVSSGLLLLGFFLLWQIPNSFVEPIIDIPFFKNLSKADYNRFFTIFKTAKRIAKIVVPMLSSVAILIAGSVSGVWILAGLIALIGAYYANKLKN